jgi:hypothetical protein
MSDKSKIGLIGTGRIRQIHTDATVRSAAKDGTIDIDPNA